MPDRNCYQRSQCCDGRRGVSQKRNREISSGQAFGHNPRADHSRFEQQRAEQFGEQTPRARRNAHLNLRLSS